MVVARYRLNVDYTSATQGTDDGHVVFTPNVNITGGSGLGTNATIVSPLGTNAIAAAVSVTPATSSSWAVTGPQTDTQFVASLKSAVNTHSSVASGTGSVTILASNALRKGGRIFNTDANALFLDLSGGTAVAASRAQVMLAQNEGYSIEAGYTGLITGIWAGDGSGNASVVETTLA